MNRIFSVLVAVTMATTGLDALAGSQEPSGPAAFVAAVRGPASVERDGEPLPARIGMQILQGDVLCCGPKARLKVLFTDDAVLALGSDTKVVVTEHIFDPGKSKRLSRFRLANGTLRALVQKLVTGSQVDFTVHTSNAVAGVRGTEFVLVAQDAHTRLYTLSGQVDLQGEDQAAVRVAAGMGSQVGEDGQAADAVAVAGEILATLRNATDTEQNPTALAWNARVAPEDRLTATGTASESGQADYEGSAGAQGPGSEGEDTDEPPPSRLDIDPCSSCIDPGPEYGDTLTTGNSFSADDSGLEGSDFHGDLEGTWESSPGLDIDPAFMHPVTLKIHIHR